MRIKKRVFRHFDMADLSEKIMSYRRLHNLSIAEFAKRAGISMWTVCRLENRRRLTVYGGTRAALENLGIKLKINHMETK